MREYELIIDEALKNGLYPDKVSFNSQMLSECLGFRCGDYSLEAAQLGFSPLPVAIDIHYSWPFPQVVTGATHNILIVRDLTGGNDYVYSFSDDHSTVSLLTSLSHTTYGFGDLVEIADFGEYLFMTNGVAMVYWDTTAGSWAVTTSTANVPLMKTVCNLNGQAIGGNIQSPWYDCDETFYIWSKIGYMNFTPESDNEAGYARCPYGGEIFHVRNLGNAVVGYSSKGLTMLHTASVGDYGPAVIGLRKVSNIGLVNKGAIDGDESKQVYIGSDLKVREITSEGIKELGYRHWMQQLGTDEDILVLYDRFNHDFYIGNSEKTYLLSSKGMTEVLQHPSAVWRTNSDYIYMLPYTLDDDYPRIATVPFDMSFKGHKTISTIETDVFNLTNPEANVDYTYNHKDWGTTQFTPINNLGIATINITGNAFRFRLRFSDIEEDFSIGMIKPRYKMTDLRGTRGVYAPPLRGQ